MTGLPTRPTREEILADKEALLDLMRITARQAEEARDDVVKMFEYVLVEETTRKAIKVAPHQRVGLDFMVKHDRSVNMWPIGHSKTYAAAGLVLDRLGHNNTQRGAIVSATQQQAMKPLAMVRDYIETSVKLRAVFPGLKPSLRKGDPWTQTAITVDRPEAIRDPSVMAVGIDGAIDGSRLSWVVIDDILTMENTGTKDQRDKVYEWVSNSVLSRLDPANAWIAVINVAWHPDDLLHRLRKLGWPTIRMEVNGDIEINTPPVTRLDGVVEEDRWGVDDAIAKELRPVARDPEGPTSRLTAHDPDTAEKVPLWPERFSRHFIDVTLPQRHLPHEINRLYNNRVRDDLTARCKQEWIDSCKLKAIEHAIHSMVSEYRGPNLTLTGVDLAVSPGEENDDTAFFTFEVLPGGLRRILDIEVGQWDGPTIVKKIFAKHLAYNSIVRVENNAAQDYIRQFALAQNISLPIKAHTTGRAKAHPEHGVEGLFLEMSNGAWMIPCSRAGDCHPQVQGFIDACLYYAPSKHTHDVLMACYFAREQAKDFGAGWSGDAAGAAAGGALANIGVNILAR